MADEAKCSFSGAWSSEGDGVRMLTVCVVHPSFFWYSEQWPTADELESKMKQHRKQLAEEASGA